MDNPLLNGGCDIDGRIAPVLLAGEFQHLLSPELMAKVKLYPLNQVGFHAQHRFFRPAERKRARTDKQVPGRLFVPVCADNLKLVQITAGIQAHPKELANVIRPVQRLRRVLLVNDRSAIKGGIGEQGIGKQRI